MKTYLARVGGVLLASSIFSFSTLAGLNFSFTNEGGASAAMMTGMAEAASIWSSRLNDSITINIRVNASALPAGVIAHTDTFYDPYSYSSFRSALIADRTSSDDQSATNHLQSGAVFSMLINRTANNPSGVVSATPYFDTGLGGPGQAGSANNSTVRISSANAKAMGLYPANSPGIDGTITISNTVSFDFNRSNGIGSSQVDFVGVVAHEMGHLMGFVSGVDVLNGNSAAPGLTDNQLQYVTPLDQFRF